jgi:hypothetical protein
MVLVRIGSIYNANKTCGISIYDATKTFLVLCNQTPRRKFKTPVSSIVPQQLNILRARCSIVGWGTILQAGRLRISFSMRVVEFFQFT